MDNFFLPKLATSPVSLTNLTNHPRLSMFIHSNMGITKIDRIATHKGGLQNCRSSAAKWPLFHVILLDFIASCCRGMSCEVVGGPVFCFKPNFICYRCLFEDKCDSFFCEFFGQLDNFFYGCFCWWLFSILLGIHPFIRLVAFNLVFEWNTGDVLRLLLKHHLLPNIHFWTPKPQGTFGHLFLRGVRWGLVD